MEAWLTQNFELFNGEIVVWRSNNGIQTADIAWLTNQLSGLSVPPTLTALSATNLATSGGWQPIFDQWKTKGIVS